MNRLTFVCLLFSLLLYGCASETNTINYYKLGAVNKAFNPDNTGNGKSNRSNRSLIVIEPILLPDFLRQQGLVIQKTDHQLQISNNHRWAESLESAISRVVQSHLENQLPEYRFENQTGRWKLKPQFRLSIELAEFQVNNRESKVITSGRFWIFNQNEELVSKERFLIEESLSSNGYEHAISNLEITLNKLVDKLGSAIKVLAN